METDRCKIPPLITESTEIEVISLDKIPIKAMKFSNISFKLTNMNSNSVQKTCVVLVPEIDVFPAANIITLKAILKGFWIVSSKCKYLSALAYPGFFNRYPFPGT